MNIIIKLYIFIYLTKKTFSREGYLFFRLEEENRIMAGSYFLCICFSVFYLISGKLKKPVMLLL